MPGFPRPLLDLGAKVFADAFDAAFGFNLDPPFDPYKNSINFLLASYLVPYVGLTGYVGANQHLTSTTGKRVSSSVLLLV